MIPSKGNYLAEASPARGEAPSPIRLTRGLDDPLDRHSFADLDRARHADMAVAFLLMSGLEHGVRQRVEQILEHPGSRVRILVGDYQDVTEPATLRALLNLKAQVEAEVDDFVGALEVRVFETSRAHVSFHPKAYLLYAGADRRPLAAYVGSSNLTRTGLGAGRVEWNLRIVDETAEVSAAFEALFGHAQSRVLTHAWVRAYEERRKPPLPGRSHVVGGVEVAPPDEPPTVVPEPHEVQAEALVELEATREAGNKRGLVVLATGLGKTWLSAFDSVPERGFSRVLFVAHREEILKQAMDTFAQIRPDATLGLYTGKHKDVEAEVVFASVMTLGRDRHLQRFEADAFDYVVVDEFHHACASTYRAVLRYLEPKFVLGLTATPERTDGGDLLGLCDENVVYECGLAEAINRRRLSPFAYFGVPDEVEYDKIPWRSRKFDEAALTRAVETTTRAQNALEQLRARGGHKTLGFCVSRTHATFMRDYFVQHGGLRAAAVHSGDDSDPRATSLQRLADGELDVIFCVDMFNEGLDVPAIDTVLMLRPTESKILWLQQLGRGLRKAEGKSHLRVIDYIGNHRVFLNKPAALLAAFGRLTRTRAEIARILRAQDFRLPAGCSVTYDVEALEILDRLYPPSKGVTAIREWYEDFKEANERRPTALEAYHSGYNVGALRREYGGWFEFVREMGDLGASEKRGLDEDRELLGEIETTAMTRSYKMVLLRALLELGELPGQASMEAVTDAFARVAGRSGMLRRDVSTGLEDRGKLRGLIRRNPAKYLAEAKGESGRALFVLSRDGFGTGDGVVGGEAEALAGMCEELVDYRLARYLDDARAGPRFRVLRNASGKPILKIDRDKYQLPQGWAPVTIDGGRYEANFVKHYVNVVRPEGSERNVLPELMRGWFGEDAGQPGTVHSVAQDGAPEGGYSWRPAEVGGGEAGAPMKVMADDGTTLDAHFCVEERDGATTIVFMSRGGGRNNDYERALELLLARLSKMGAEIARITVETRDTKTLSDDRRTLAIADAPYPIPLAKVEDLRKFRIAIGRAGAAVGRKRGTKGNPTKRLRIWVSGVEIGGLAEALRTG